MSVFRSLVLVGMFSVTVSAACAQSTQLASTPPMGWNSWNHFKRATDDAVVRAAADAMVSSGMRDEGYTYINIDDAWEGERDAQGFIHPNSKFPDMKALADYVHSKGLKLGLYSSPGPKTCAKFEGSYGHEQQDADTYAGWGIDYLKYDLCGLRPIMEEQSHGDPVIAEKIMRDAYLKMYLAIQHTHRPIMYSLCQYGWDSVWKWGPSVGANLWRTTGDVNDNYDRMSVIGFSQAGLARYAGKGHWNDPDMLEIGNGGMTADGYRTQMSLWALLAAPLLAGNDLSAMDEVTKSILMNREAISIDQDPLGEQGDRVQAIGPIEIWMRRLAGGDRAVGIFNRGPITNDPVVLHLKDVGFNGPVHAWDVWAQKDLGVIKDSYSVVVPSRGVVLLRLSAHPQTASIQGGNVEVTLTQAGSYVIRNQSNHLSMTGQLTDTTDAIHVSGGVDAIGAYKQIEARYTRSSRTAAMRLYPARDAVMFLDEHHGVDSNVAPFPSFQPVSESLQHLSYRVYRFAPIDFNTLDAQGPWIFFDHDRNTMVLSSADSFLTAHLEQATNGELRSGIDPTIKVLPADFTHRTLVTFGSGITQTLNAWGSALQQMHHKPPVSNDADVVLNKFGYWTDNGASYYYKFDPSSGYEGTLLAVRDQYKQLGVPLGYMQLDSWWYPKQKGNTAKGDNGALIYRADKQIFPDGLDGFHKQLDLPLVTHARWISEGSPYRSEYKMSNNVIIDPRFWSSTAGYLKAGGVAVYEQDWLDENARPAMDIAQSHEFLSEMASAMRREDMAIQYCMALPAYFMASTEFPNLRTIRTSDDRFGPNRYDSFLYTSALGHALGLWPWSDVFMSSELSNLVVSTLSVGPVGTGDALGAIDAASLKRVMRSDSVLLKPDTPLIPMDAMYLADAASSSLPPAAPMVAMTQTSFGAVSEKYVFSYPRTAGQASAEMALSEFGITQRVYAWDWKAEKGAVLAAGGTLPLAYENGWAYVVLAPIDSAGIALLGDTSKIVPLARKRFTGGTNVGGLNTTISFATGESSIVVMGYAEHQPRVMALTGSVGDLRYDTATHLFTFAASPGNMHPAKVHMM